MKKKNRKFIDEYQIKDDGSLADSFMKGCKKFVAEEDKVTPADKRKRSIYHKKKMAEVMQGIMTTLSKGDN